MSEEKACGEGGKGDEGVEEVEEGRESFVWIDHTLDWARTMGLTPRTDLEMEEYRRQRKEEIETKDEDWYDQSRLPNASVGRSLGLRSTRFKKMADKIEDVSKTGGIPRELECEHCHIAFTVSGRGSGKVKYCSEECTRLGRLALKREWNDLHPERNDRSLQRRLKDERAVDGVDGRDEGGGHDEEGVCFICKERPVVLGTGRCQQCWDEQLLKDLEDLEG